MGRIRAVTAVLAATGIVLLAGCGASGNDNATSDSAPAARQGAEGGSGAGNAKPQAPAQGTQQGTGQGNQQGNQQGTEQGSKDGAGDSQDDPSVARAIIRTGSLTVEGDNVSDLRQKAVTVVASLNGQVASEDTGSDADGTVTRSNLVLKVPTKSFETAIQRLSELGKRLQIHQESTDVTEQVVDVASRIESQRASLERMRALMARANSISEIVSVESELTRREADLESLLAKQKNLALQTDLATLTLTLTQKGKPPVQTEQEPDKGFLAGLKGGWNAFTATFSALATVAGALLPFLVLLALIAVPLWRFRHKLRRSPAQAPTSGQ